MGIRWGHSSGYLSLGIDMWYSGDPNSGSVTITAVYYVRADGYGHNFNSTLRFSGETSGARGYSFYSPTGGNTVQEVYRVSWSKSTVYGSVVTATSGFTTDTIWNGGKPSASASIQIPARAYQSPAAPTAVSARRQSDSQITISWSQDTSTAAPVTSFAVERMSESDPVWRRVGTVGNGSARSWSDTSVSANQKYTYRVWAGNGKASPATASAPVSTTPSAPTSVQATKTGTGDVIVAWKPTAAYGVGGYTIFDNGSQVGSAPAGATSWTHTRPSTLQTHSYTVRADEGSLHSMLSAPSPTVQLLAPPGVPRALTVDETVQAGRNVRFAWAHNPVDSSGQTSAKARYKLKSSQTWTEASVQGSVQHLDRLLSPGVYEWQVQTWGSYKAGQSAGASPWSSPATIRVSSQPTVRITSPVDVVRAASIEVEWAFFQAESAGQASAEVTLLTTEALLERQTVDSSLQSVRLKTRLQDKTEYFLSVRVCSAFGLWSDTELMKFRADFPVPGEPSLLTEWDEATGQVSVTVINPAPTVDQVEAVRNAVLRSVDGGDSWETIAEDIPVGGSLSDGEALSNGETQYKAVAYTDLETAAAGEVSTVNVRSAALWVSGGAGFNVTLSLRLNPKINESRSLVNRNVVFFAGRKKGVELAGIQQAAGFDVSGTILEADKAALTTLRALAVTPAPILLRTPAGERFYCSLGGMDASRSAPGLLDVKVRFEEVER